MRGVLLDGDEPAGIGGTRDKREAQTELTIAMGGPSAIGQTTGVLDRHGRLALGSKAAIIERPAWLDRGWWIFSASSPGLAAAAAS